MRTRPRPTILPLAGAGITTIGIFADLYGFDASWPLIWIGLVIVVVGSFVEA